MAQMPTYLHYFDMVKKCLLQLSTKSFCFEMEGGIRLPWSPWVVLVQPPLNADLNLSDQCEGSQGSWEDLG